MSSRFAPPMDTVRCPSCARPLPEDSRFCPSCGAALSATQSPTETGGQDVFSVATTQAMRFLPGVTLKDRYRIVALIGRGGMGEVYRADDLRLGQPVALKFLPPALEDDPAHLASLLNEVRLARQVSHPNVCRVYDVDEVEGHHFVSMEYVDGEDLGSLLRQIGRLPEEKAVQIARQLCAGLSAVHEQGLLHRDLKPSNVMIDGRGRVRIADFGVAGLASELGGGRSRAGTPQYMAPEQLSRGEVSVRSDLYSLGLVLYELFTGKCAFDAGTPAEIARLHRETTPSSPSTHVEGLHPAVERVILRCLERDPGDRPASALQVAGRLPGGDPLAAALAAGDTPSPEMVAAAGPREGLRSGVAIVLLAAMLLGLALAVTLSARTSLHNRVPLVKSFEALRENAREIVSELGYTEAPADSAATFYFNQVEYLHVGRRDETGAGWEALGQPSQMVVELIYRQSPRPLLPRGLSGDVAPGDPPQQPGDVELWLDLRGRLCCLRAAPQRHAKPPDESRPTDWSTLFEAAGLELDQFEPTTPTLLPEAFADTRRAWTGRLADQGGRPARIEAASLWGRPVYFEKIVSSSTLWRPGSEREIPLPEGLAVASAAAIVVLAVLAVGGLVLLAVRSLRLGRGDRRGATRIAVAVFLIRLLHWLFTGHHVAHPAEVFLAAIAVSGALALAAASWVSYIALEPYVRRFWPEAIVSWSRLLSGRLRDPLVGRDWLVGSAAAIGLAALCAAMFAVGESFGFLSPIPGGLTALRGGRYAVGSLFSTALGSLAVASFLVVLFLVLRLLLRRTWAAAVVFAALFGVYTGLSWSTLFGYDPIKALAIGLVWGAFTATVLVWIMVRFGLLALVAEFACGLLLAGFPITPDPSLPYFTVGLFGPLVVAALAAWAFRNSLERSRVATLV